MQFLYTGATTEGDVQTDPLLSLGHKVSSSPIPNDLLHNLFPEASYLSIQQKKRETRLIVLKNITAQKATGLSVYFTQDGDESVSGSTNGSIVVYRVAFVLPDSNGCFEQIINGAALPFNATFQDVVNNVAFSLPDLDADKVIGMWISRLYNFQSEDLKEKDCTYYNDQLTNPTVPGTEDRLDIVVDYTLV